MAAKGILHHGNSKIVTSIPEVPVTMMRPVDKLADLDTVLPNPGAPRAYQAADREHPNGSANSIKGLTVLQQHCAFWDRDNDGRIYISDTYTGTRELGFPIVVALAITAVLHFSLFIPWLTQDSWILDPRLIIYIKNAHRIKHGSDSRTYDTEGRFVPQKFEEIFSKYDAGDKGGLDLSDIFRMVAGQRLIWDFVGWGGTLGEWLLTYWLVRDQRGLITKDRVRRIFDGTLFYDIAEEVRVKKDARTRKWKAT